MKLQEFAHHEPVTAVPTSSLRETAELMQSQNVGAVVIIDDDNKVVGIVTDRDLALATTVRGLSPDQPVGDVMHRKVVTIWEDEGIFNATQYFLGHRVRRLPIVNRQEQLLGVLSADDLFALFARELFNVARALEPALGERV
jgi:signal-transduction protein with cAMP-binding, CBS, and nucleotidyltransferase domain